MKQPAHIQHLALEQRQALLTANLKRKTIRRNELPNGYSYTLPYRRKVLQAVSHFVESEQECCDFFDFTIIEWSAHELHLEITGPAGAKEQGVLLRYAW